MFNTYDKYKKELKINTELPDFCEKYFNDLSKKCKKFYEEICDSDKCFFICPYGFSCLKTKSNIYTSLIVQKKTNISKVKIHLETYGQKMSDFTIYSYSQLVKIIEQMEKKNDDNDVYEQTIHDIKNANISMIDLSESIEKNEEIQKVIYKHQELISLVEGYGLIRHRLDYHDCVLNDSLSYTKRCCSINLYKIIKKLRYQLLYKAKKKSVNIIIEGSAYNNFNQQVALYLGYFLLLENAIKYSMENEKIIVKLEDISSSKTEVIIQNVCLPIEKEELIKIKTKGFRTNSAISSAQGKGLGLSLADSIFSDSKSELLLDFQLEKDKKKGLFTAKTLISDI